MTDPIREAFEKWRATGPHMSPMSVWQAAWQQSRRETLAEFCERAERAAMGGNIRCAVTAMKMVEVIRAAAEEEGK